MGNNCTSNSNSPQSAIPNGDYFGIPLQVILEWEGRINATATSCTNVIPYLVQDIHTAIQAQPNEGSLRDRYVLQTLPLLHQQRAAILQQQQQFPGATSVVSSPATSNANSSNALTAAVDVHPAMQRGVGGGRGARTVTIDEGGGLNGAAAAAHEGSIRRLCGMRKAINDAARRYEDKGATVKGLNVFGKALENQHCNRTDLLHLLLFFLMALPSRPFPLSHMNEVANHCTEKVDAVFGDFEANYDGQDDDDASSGGGGGGNGPTSIVSEEHLKKERDFINGFKKDLRPETIDGITALCDRDLIEVYPKFRLSVKMTQRLAREKNRWRQIHDRITKLDGDWNPIAKVVDVDSSKSTTATQDTSGGNAAGNNHHSGGGGSQQLVTLEEMNRNPYFQGGPGALFNSVYCSNASAMGGRNSNAAAGGKNGPFKKLKGLTAEIHFYHPSTRLFFWILALFNGLMPESHMLCFDDCCYIVAAMCEYDGENDGGALEAPLREQCDDVAAAAANAINVTPANATIGNNKKDSNSGGGAVGTTCGGICGGTDGSASSPAANNGAAPLHSFTNSNIDVPQMGGERIAVYRHEYEAPAIGMPEASSRSNVNSTNAAGPTSTGNPRVKYYRLLFKHPMTAIHITSQVKQLTEALLMSFCHLRPHSLQHPRLDQRGNDEEPIELSSSSTAAAQQQQQLHQSRNTFTSTNAKVGAGGLRRSAGSDGSGAVGDNGNGSPIAPSSNLKKGNSSHGGGKSVTLIDNIAAADTTDNDNDAIDSDGGYDENGPSACSRAKEDHRSAGASTAAPPTEDDEDDFEGGGTASVTATARTKELLAAKASSTTNAAIAAKGNANSPSKQSQHHHHKRVHSAAITEHLSGPNWTHQGSQDTSAIIQSSSDEQQRGSPAGSYNNNNHSVIINDIESHHNNNRQRSGSSNRSSNDYNNHNHHRNHNDNNVDDGASPRSRHSAGAYGDVESTAGRRPNGNSTVNMSATARYLADGDSAFYGPPLNKNSGAPDSHDFRFSGVELSQRLNALKQNFMRGQVQNINSANNAKHHYQSQPFANDTYDNTAQRVLGKDVAKALRDVDDANYERRAYHHHNHNNQQQQQHRGGGSYPSSGTASISPVPSMTPSQQNLSLLVSKMLRDDTDGISNGFPSDLKQKAMRSGGANYGASAATRGGGDDDDPSITPAAKEAKRRLRQDQHDSVAAEQEIKIRNLCAVVELLKKDNGRLRSDLGAAMDDIGDAMERLHHDHSSLKGMVGRSTAHKAFRERVQTILADVADSQVGITEDVNTVRTEVRLLREALLGSERDRNGLADEILSLRAELENAKARWASTEREVLKQEQTVAVVDRRVAEAITRGRVVENELKTVQFGQEVIMRKGGGGGIGAPGSVGLPLPTAAGGFGGYNAASAFDDNNRNDSTAFGGDASNYASYMNYPSAGGATGAAIGANIRSSIY